MGHPVRQFHDCVWRRRNKSLGCFLIVVRDAAILARRRKRKTHGGLGWRSAGPLEDSREFMIRSADLVGTIKRKHL